MKKIKLHEIAPPGPIGPLLIDPESIRSVATTPGTAGATVTVKANEPVAGVDAQAAAKVQCVYFVKESVDEVDALLNQAQAESSTFPRSIFEAVEFADADALKKVEYIITQVKGSREEAIIKAFNALDDTLKRWY